MTSARYDQAVFIGRFQPFHNGHLALLRQALAAAHRVIVVLGSSFQARTPKNPFTWQERADMIRASVALDDAGRLTFLPVRDYYDDDAWNQAVSAGVLSLQQGPSTALMRHFKDSSSYYQRNFPDWIPVDCERAGMVDATTLRDIFLDRQAMPGGFVLLAEQVPAPVAQFLAAFRHLQTYDALVDYQTKLVKDKAAWAGAPYPPTFVTADALVRMNKHILLLRRAGSVGTGLLAMPGGYVETHDFLLDAAIRELREETAFGLYPSVLLTALKEVRVFDHPGRSQRGRIVTHVHVFDFGDMAPLEVHGNGSEGEPAWVPEERLVALEDQFFSDHFHILDSVLGLTGPVAPARPQSRLVYCA